MCPTLFRCPHLGHAMHKLLALLICSCSSNSLTVCTSRACSIGDYMEQRRMEAAKRLLMEGESVKSIAFAMGFASPSSFTFAFRRAVGTSPSTFRQRQVRVLDAPLATAGN